MNAQQLIDYLETEASTLGISPSNLAVQVTIQSEGPNQILSPRVNDLEVAGIRDGGEVMWSAFVVVRPRS